MTIETYITIDGLECVTWTDEQGTHSMLKSTYEALEAAKVKHLREIVPGNE